jgi:5-methylcytosine-specific restriction endonuclease McrA
MGASLKRRNELYNKYCGRCYLCGCDISFDNFQIEHVLPKARGGLTNINNLNPVCGICNATKGPLTLDEYRRKIQNIHKTSTGAILLCKYQSVEIGEVVFYFELFGDGVII